jgi:hypothetical protein
MVVFGGTQMLMVMSMGSDYVSEVRPTAGLLFILQVVYVYREPRCNYIDRETPDLSTRALAILRAII